MKIGKWGILFVMFAGLNMGHASAQNAPAMPVHAPAGKVEGAVQLLSVKKIDVLDFNQVEIMDVLRLISQKVNRNIAASQSVKGKVNVYLKDITLLDALRVIVDSYGWAYVEEDGIIKVITAQEYEEKFGQKFGRDMRTRIFEIKYGNTNNISTFLGQIKTPAGKILVDEKSNTLIVIDSPEKLANMEDIIARLDTPTKTEVFNLSYAKAKDMSDEIKQYLTPALGDLTFDDRSNRMIITDTYRVLAKVRNIINAYDVKHKEVFIQAKIVQVVLDNEHKMGINWEAIVSGFKDLTFSSDFDVLSSTEKRGKVAIGTLSEDDFELMIEALDTVGDTNILSSPRIMALNNQEAKILVGSSEPYVTSTSTATSAGLVNTAESVNFIDVGVKLYVTPTIHEDGFITMKIKPEVSSAVDELPTSTNNVIPIVETSEAETTVMVKDGVTIVMGGLIKEEKIKNVKRVPLLGRIPVLGAAFRSVSDSVKKTEIVIFINPTIVTGDVEHMAADPKG